MHFFIQRFEVWQEDQRITGVEAIGHERQFRAEPGAGIKSRFYSSTGDAIDCVCELEADTLNAGCEL